MQCTCIQLQHTGEHTFGMYMHRTMLNDIPTFLPPLQSLSRSATILLLLPVIVCESQLHPLVWHMNTVHTRNNMQCLHTVCLFACKSYAQHRTIIVQCHTLIPSPLPPPHVSLLHEQSYYIVHYIRRKEEGKEGRKKRTNTDNLQQPQRLRKICVHTLPASAA